MYNENEINKQLKELKKTTEELENNIDEVFNKEQSEIYEKLELLENKEEKRKLMEEYKEKETEYLETKEQIEELNNTILSEDNLEKDENITNSIETRAYFEQRLLDENISEEEKKRYKFAIEEINHSLSLDYIKNKLLIKNKNDLKKNYNKLLKEVYSKLKNDNMEALQYPNINKLKESLKSLLMFVYPGISEKDINNNAKILGSIILQYIMSVKLSDKSLFIFYMLDNIIYMSELPIEEQIKFQTNLLSLAKNLFINN